MPHNGINRRGNVLQVSCAGSFKNWCVSHLQVGASRFTHHLVQVLTMPGILHNISESMSSCIARNADVSICNTVGSISCLVDWGGPSISVWRRTGFTLSSSATATKFITGILFIKHTVIIIRRWINYKKKCQKIAADKEMWVFGCWVLCSKKGKKYQITGCMCVIDPCYLFGFYDVIQPLT